MKKTVITPTEAMQVTIGEIAAMSSELEQQLSVAITPVTEMIRESQVQVWKPILASFATSVTGAFRELLKRELNPIIKHKDRISCQIALQSIHEARPQDLIYLTTEILELPPEKWFEVTKAVESGEWKTRDDPLGYIRARVTRKRGRPKGSGMMDKETFQQVVRKAVIHLNRQRIHPSQERVAEYMAYHLGSKHDPRQIRRWMKSFGYASWEELLREILP